MTPVHHSRNDQPIDIAQNFLEALAFFRWMLGKTRTNSAWFIVRRDTQCLDIFTEISNPVGEFVKLPAKLFRGRVAERLSIFHCFSNFINAGGVVSDLAPKPLSHGSLGHRPRNSNHHVNSAESALQ